MKKTTLFLFLSPWLITFSLFWAYPICHALILSFMDYNPLRPEVARWIGLDNYRILISDPTFRIALQNTGFFVFGTIPVTTILALGLALLINQKLPFKDIYRAGFFMPSIISIVVIALIFKGLYAPNGYLNYFLSFLGIKSQSWLVNPELALPSIMAMDIWEAIGYYMVLFLAGLQTIPPEIYESSAMDGAGAGRRFWHITLPYLRPMILFVLVINTIRSFQVFTEIFTLTNGGPLKSTYTIVYYLYETGFHRFAVGYASAIAYILFLIILGFSLLQMKALRLDRGVAD
ncbi:MAG: sugar ABC transporter permease [bacterium]|nr:sugar ABC transporter permease [bacterium]